MTHPSGPSLRPARLASRRASPELLILLCLSATFFPPGDASAQIVRSDLWTTDGAVSAATISGNTLYVGGTFTYVGPRNGAGVAVDATTGVPAAGFPEIEGTVNVAIADGAGGWYVGGVFTTVGGIAKNNLVRITSTNVVDPTFNPNPNAPVTALALYGSRLYVGGFFTFVGGFSRLRAAAVDATTGAALLWDPVPNNSVHTMITSGSTLYVGGQFTTISGQPRNQIAQFDAATGNITGWNPGANGQVKALVADGPKLYVGGAFSTIGGQPRAWLAALDSASGGVLSWNPNPNTGAGFGITSLALAAGTMYAAGYFTTIGGQARNYLAALDTVGGAARVAWNPNPNTAVYALSVLGSTVYVGGGFNTIAGQTRLCAAAIDTATGSATSWTAHASGGVNVVAASGSSVFVGGAFNSVTGVPRINIAALDLVSGTATAWNPGASSIVKALATSASTLYAGGSFTVIGGQNRGRLAAFDLATGNLLAWNPNSTINGINALAVGGGTVYAGGAITFIGGQSRANLAAIDATSGAVTPWNPGATGGLVNALLLSGSTLYVGGNFTNVGGVARNFIAAVDASTAITDPTFNPNANNGVFSLALAGPTLYVGGFFNTIGGQTRNRIAALELVNGNATSWNPNADGAVLALTVNGSVVYGGGSFGGIGGKVRPALAALEAGSGLAVSWNPSPNASVLTLTSSTNVIYTGGTFTTLGGEAGGVAAIDAACPPPQDVADSSGTLGSPDATTAGDFDGDGMLDLAAAVDGGAQVLRNLGGGRFSSLSFESTGGSGRGIASADFNDDFVSDVALSTTTGLHVMLGESANGVPTGGLAPPTTYAVGAEASGIAVADFNEDGISDLAVAVTGSNSVKVLLGLGSGGIGQGTFAAPTSFAVGAAPLFMVVGDFNADGIWDLAVTDSGSARVSVLRGQGTGGVGNGAFGAAVGYAVASGPRAIVTGDFNEDGATDLAVGGTAAVSVLLGRTISGIPDGTFLAATHYSVSGPVRDLVLADFDADGRADLGAPLGSGGTLQYLYGDGSYTLGNGNFQMGASLFISGYLSTLEFGAFDPLAGDGSVVLALRDRAELVSLQGLCFGATAASVELTSPNGGEAWQLGTNVPITWARNARVQAVHAEISRDNGAHWKRIASNLVGSRFDWTVTPPGTPHGRVRVVDAQTLAAGDASNGSFAMQPLLGVDPALLARPSFSLAYPNPARGAVRFDLRLPAATGVTIDVFDLAGRRVHTLARGAKAAGEHVVMWDEPPADGIYFVRARMGDLETIRRVVRIR